MKNDSIQLEMNFNGSLENHFKTKLDNGDFHVLVELAVPSADTPMQDAVRKCADFEYAIHSQELPDASIAFVDQNAPGYALDMVHFASELCRFARDRHLLYLRGVESSVDRAMQILRHGVSEGFKNFCFVSGSVKNETEESARKRIFTESVSLLDAFRSDPIPSVLTGAVVNPYQYVPGAAYAQFYKTMRKIHCGASFLVSQFGWDMLKLQELRWNLHRRGFPVPTIARLLFLTPDNAESICAGKYPGVHISPDFELLLKRECEHSRAQFEAAQLRRLQIHVAGARFLGCSGVQIAGIRSTDLLETVMPRIRQALLEFPSFEDWRAAYQEYYARLDMAPYPHRFHFFEGLLEHGDVPDEPVISNVEIMPLTWFERKKRSLVKKLFAHADSLPANERRLTKKLFCGCRSCSHCRLPQTDFICPELCPKGFANGPCGGNKADGSCELSDAPCVFLKRIRFANAEQNYLSLEGEPIPPPDERP